MPKASKKPSLNNRPGKYFINRTKGHNKTESARLAGYLSPSKNTGKIERTQQYQKIIAYYKDTLLDKISLAEIADEHIKNIIQDVDRGAKNKAIEMALHKIEPEVRGGDGEHEMILVKIK